MTGAIGGDTYRADAGFAGTPRSTAWRRTAPWPDGVEAMSSQVSPFTKRPYGVALVSWLWRIARAAIYRHRSPATVPGFPVRSDQCPTMSS